MTASPPDNLLRFCAHPRDFYHDPHGVTVIKDDRLLDDLKFLNGLTHECGISRVATVADCSTVPIVMMMFGHIRVDPACLAKLHRKASQLGLLRDGVIDVGLRQVTGVTAADSCST